MEKRVMSEREAALYIGMSAAFLRHDRMNGARNKRKRGPQPIKIGRSIRYLKEVLDEWLDACRDPNYNDL